MTRLFLLLFPLLAFGSSTFTSVKTGNWNDPTTWGFSAGAAVCHVNIPCMTDGGDAGDKVFLGNLSHTVTCPSATICSVGNSPSTSVPANVVLGAVSYTNTTAVLDIAGTLIYAGPVLMNNSTWIVEAGATVQHDSSWSSAPTTAAYSWSVNHSGSGTGGTLLLNGTAGSHATWIGAANSASNVSCNANACRAGTVGTNGSDNYADSGTMACSYADFSYVGAASRNALWIKTTSANSSLANCTWDNSGTLYLTEGPGGAGTVSVSGLHLTNSAETSYANGSVFLSVASSAGAKSFSNSIISGTVDIIGSATNWTFKNILFEYGANGIGFYNGWSGSAPVANTDQVMVYDSSDVDSATQSPGGTHTLWAYARYVNSGQFNMHPWYAAKGSGVTIDRAFIEGNLPLTASDFISPSNDGTGTFLLENSVYSCKQDGTTLGSFINTQAGDTANSVIYIKNNTYCSSGGNPTTDAAVMGAGWEAGNVAAGSWGQVVSNLAYRLDSSGTVEVMCSSPDGTFAAAPGAVLLVGYNAIYNNTASTAYCTSVTANGHITTGPTNDVNILRSPNFLAPNRRLIDFDTLYFGDAVSSTVWASGQSYSSGQVVSDSQVSVYSGLHINWKSISSAGGCALSSSSNRPMTGSAWTACWEPASLDSHIRPAVLAGTQFTDSSLGVSNINIVGLLNTWCRLGHTPINEPSLVSGGYAGGFIGAVSPLVPHTSVSGAWQGRSIQ